jgi:hypothetical protein
METTLEADTEAAIEKNPNKGFKYCDGIECVHVGFNTLGGSYLAYM